MTETTKRIKHTPGPWHIEHDGGSNPIITTGTRERLNVLAHIKTPNDPYETDPNARLITTAPEMYTLLNRLATMNASPNTTVAEWHDCARVTARDALALLARIDGTEGA